MSEQITTGERIQELLDGRCSSVLETMFFAPVFDLAPPESGVGEARISARVHFHGRAEGIFEVDADPDTGLMLAGGFLGVDEGDVEPRQIDECMAEFANMACGSVLSSLGEVEYFHLDSPVVTHTEAFQPAQMETRRAFALERGTLCVSLKMHE